MAFEAGLLKKALDKLATDGAGEAERLRRAQALTDSLTALPAAGAVAGGALRNAAGVGLLGAGIGSLLAPGGHRLHGAGRGLARGAGTGAGLALGGAAGVPLGAILAQALAPAHPAAATLGAAAGGLGGMGLGALTGYHLTGRAMGKAPWDERKDKSAAVLLKLLGRQK